MSEPPELVKKRKPPPPGATLETEPFDAQRREFIEKYLTWIRGPRVFPSPLTEAAVSTSDLPEEEVQARAGEAITWLSEHPYLYPKGDEVIAHFVRLGVPPKDLEEITEFREQDPIGLTQHIALRILEFFRQPLIGSVAELAGGMIYDPVLNIVTQQAGISEVPEVATARRFVGTAVLMGFLPTLAASVGGPIGLGAITGAKDALQQAYFNLGLGFLTWQGLAPVLQNSVLIPLQRAMDRQFRPTDFTLSNYQDLLAYGEISPEQYAEALRNLGYSDEKILQTLSLSYRRFGEGDIARSLEWGMWTDAQASQALRAIGWSKADIPHKLALIKRGFLDETKAVSVSLAEKALRERLISEAQFIEMLQAASKSDAEIKIRLGLVRSQMEEERRSLSVGQIKDAFLRNILTDTEVLHALEGEGYDAASAKILLASWKDAKKPKILKVNKGTITLAMARGVLSVDEALRKLQQIGYTSEDAYLIVQTQSRAGSSTASSISLPRAMEAYQRGVIDLPRLRTYVEAQVAEPAVVQFWIDLARARTERDLTPSQVEDAFEQQAITRGEADDLLARLGYDPDERRLLLDTVEARQSAFKPALSAAYLVNLTGRGVISTDELRNQLHEQGYTDTDIDILIRAAEHEEAEALDDSAIRAAYLEGVIGPDDVLGRLAGIGYTPQDAQVQLETWAAQALRTQPRAGENTLVAFAREGLLTADELAAKLEARGLPGDEVRLYVELATFEPQPGTTDLSKTDITGAYGKGLFDRFVATERLIAKGYSVEDAGVLLDLRKPDIRSNPLVSLLGVAGVDPYVILAALLGEGFSEDEVIAVVEPFLGGEG